MKGGTITILAGVLIVIAGIAMSGEQMMGNSGEGIQEHNFTLISAEFGSTSLHVGTGFPGLPLIVLGMLILLIGSIKSRGN